MHELICDDKYEVCVQEVWKCAFLSFFKGITIFFQRNNHLLIT